MGLLSGRYNAQTRFGPDNVRGSGMPWLRYFRDGRPVPETNGITLSGLGPGRYELHPRGALGWRTSAVARASRASPSRS